MNCQGGKDLLLRDQAHVTGHFPELLTVGAAIERAKDALDVTRGEDLQIDENFAQLLSAAHVAVPMGRVTWLAAADTTAARDKYRSLSGSKRSNCGKKARIVGELSSYALSIRSPAERILSMLVCRDRCTACT